MSTLVDFGRATFTHPSTSSWMSCSASATTHGETENVESEAPISARSFSHQPRWVRCRVPILFNFSFFLDGCVGWTSHDYSIAKQEIVAIMRSTKLWEHLGLSVGNVQSTDDVALTTREFKQLNICVDLSPTVRQPRSFKKWQHGSNPGVNDINCPPKIQRSRLDSINVEFRLHQSSTSDASRIGSESTSFFSSTILPMIDSSLRSLFCPSSRMAKGVRKGNHTFDDSLRSAFPSIFWPAYLDAVTQRANLSSAISRNLAAYCSRVDPRGVSSQPFTELGLSSAAQETTLYSLDSTSKISSGLEAQLWGAALSIAVVSERVTGLPRLQSKSPKPNILNFQTETDPLDVTLSKDDSYTRSEDGASLDEKAPWHCLLGDRADQARDFSNELLSREQLKVAQQSDDTTTCPSHSFEELAEMHMLLDSSNSNEWASYWDKSPASSQTSAISSDVYGFAEESRVSKQSNQVEEFSEWEELIGQCEQLTQTPIRPDPPDDDMLTGRLSLGYSDLNLEDLHTSTVSFDNDTSSDSDAVIDIDPVAHAQLAYHASHPLTERIAASFDSLVRTESGALFEPIQPVLPADIRGRRAVSNELFGTDDYDMDTNNYNQRGWSLESPPRATVATHAQQPSGRLHRRKTSQPETDTPPQQFFPRSFIKRSSTTSMLSSTSASPPRRHESLLKRLSRSSSKASKHEEQEMADFDVDQIRGRNVELKRRKTLDDYDIDEDQDDDEMLFV